MGLLSIFKQCCERGTRSAPPLTSRDFARYWSERCEAMHSMEQPARVGAWTTAGAWHNALADVSGRDKRVMPEDD